MNDRIPAWVVRGARDVATLWVGVTIALALWVSPDPFAIAESPGYAQDGLAHGLLIKTVMEVGWYPVITHWIGAPFGAALFDYPFSDGANLALIKLFGMFTSDWVVVANVFFLAGFYLASLAAYYTLRRLGIAPTWAIVGGLLFAFLPYHLLRREHMLLVSYFTVPLGLLLAWYAWRGIGIATWGARHLVPRVLLVLAAGSGGVYYAFFSAAFVGLATAARMVRERSWRAGVVGGVLIAGIALTVVANVLPSLAFWAAQGPNPDVAARAPGESDVYGLRLTQMLLPQPAHRVDSMRDLTASYEQAFPLVNENRTAALGVAGSVGLIVIGLMMLASLAGGRRPSPRASFLTLIAGGAFLLGTMGGAGSLFAFAVTPVIRGYNRISVAIAFVALAALVIVVQRVAERARLGTIATVAVALGVVVLGILDQTPRQDVAIKHASRSDLGFVAAAERALPANTMVWQMPYQPFPESYWVHRMPHYGPLRGYLNSSHLRWSYGAIKGREGDAWLRAVSARPTQEQIDLAARSGFGAVYVDRRGYADRGEAVLSELRDKLGPPLVESIDGDLVMFRMTPRGNVPLPWRAVRTPIDTPIRFDRRDLGPLVKDVTGLSGFEGWGRWTDKRAVKVQLSQALPLRFTLRLETVNAISSSAATGLVARVGGTERDFKVGTGPTVVDLPFAHSSPSRTIEILVPNAASPKSLGMNDDERLLGVGIKSITILPPPVGS